MRAAKPSDLENAGSALFAGRIGFSSLRREVKARNVIVNAALYVDADGVRATIPVYDPVEDETTVCVLTVSGKGPHIYKTLQAAKNAMHKCGITHYSIVRDGVECWA